MEKIKISRTTNTKRNIKYSLIMKIISLIIPFFSRILMIRLIGAEYLGLGSLFISILQVLNLAELGFSTAIIFFMYEPIARGNNEELGALLLYFKTIYRIIGIFISIIGLIILPFLPKIIKGNLPNDINIYILYIIFLFNTSCSYLWYSYRGSLFYAYQRNDIINKIHMCVFVCEQILQILSIIYTKNIYLYYSLRLIGTITHNTLIAYYTKKMYPNIIEKGIISKEKQKEIITKVKGLMINKICLVSRNAFDSIYISAFLGLIDTAKYNNYYYILLTLQGITAIIRTSISAGVGNSIITETNEKNYKDFKIMDFLYMWMIGWITVCILCLYQPFMTLMFGRQMLYPNKIMISFCSYFYVMRMGDIRYVYSEAKGLWWENRYRSFFESITNVFLNYYLGRIWGVQGIILSTLISILFFNYIWSTFITYKYYFKENSPYEYFKNHAIYFIIVFLTCIICFYVSLLFSPQNPLLSLVINLINVILIPCIIFQKIYKKTYIYKISIKWLFNKIQIPTFIKQVITI